MGQFFKTTKEWANSDNQKNVDFFAKRLREEGLTHGKLMLSLSSKVLFLNNPWEIIPMDRFTKDALELKVTSYSNYLEVLREYEERNKAELSLNLDYLKPFFEKIENHFKDIEDIRTIRKNRFVDKVLWAKGSTDYP